MKTATQSACLAVAALALCLNAAPTFAVTHCVNTTGAGGCATKIQDAIDAAGGAGDTVAIAAGIYNKDTLPILVTGAAHDGLRISGPQSAIIDPIYRTAGISGVTLQVSSNNVSVTGLTFRNCPGAVIDVFGTGFVLSATKITGSTGDGVVFENGANGGTVKSSKLEAIGGEAVHAPASSTGLTIQSNTFTYPGPVTAVDIDGDDAHVLSNKFANTYSSAIYVNGSNAIVQRNTMTNAWSAAIYVTGTAPNVSYNKVVESEASSVIYVGGDDAVVNNNNVASAFFGIGIEVQGTNAMVAHNVIAGAYQEGIWVPGNDATVTANVISATGSSGIYIQGDNPTVTSNIVKNSAAGIYIACETYPFNSTTSQCTGGSVSLNKVSNIDGGDGIDVIAYSETAPVTVLSNSVIAASNRCFHFDANAGTPTSGMTLTTNHATNCGVPVYSSYAFNILGNGFTLTGNTAVSSADDAFSITGSDATLVSNSSSFARGHAFAIHGDNATLTTNHATGFGASGYALYSGTSGHTLGGNTVAAPGIVGFCYATGATFTDAGGNKFLSATDGVGTNPPTPVDCTRAYGFR